MPTDLFDQAATESAPDLFDQAAEQPEPDLFDQAASEVPQTLGDKSSRFLASAAKQGIQTVSGALRVGQLLQPQLFALADEVAKATGLATTQEFQTELEGAASRAEDDYGVNPNQDNSFLSTLASGAGSLLPTLASGPFAPLTTGLSMGEQGYQEAEQAGASDIQKGVAFAGNAAVGYVTEKLLGLPALLKAVQKAKIPEKTFRALVGSVAKQAGLSFAREGTQETLEQVSQDLIAKYISAYDPKRNVFDGKKLATVFLAGGLIGAPIGGGLQLAENVSPEGVAPKEEMQKEAASIDASLAQVAAAEPPPLPVPQGTPIISPEDIQNVPRGTSEEPPRASQPEVISTAIRNPDGTVTTGKNRETPHKELIREHLKKGGSANTEDILDNMGFLIRDESGQERFATREEAYAIAEKTGQLIEPAKNKRLASEIFQPQPTEPNAQAIRSNEGQISESGIVPEVGPAKSGQNLQFETSQQPSGAAPQVQEAVTQEQAAKAIEPYREAGIAMAKRAGAADNAEDIFQEVQIELSRQISEGKSDLSKIGGLISKAVRNKTQNYLESQQAEKRGGGKVGTLEEVTTEPAQTRGPRAEAVSAEDVGSIEQAITKLPEAQSRVMRAMIENPGISDLDISKLTGQSEEAVRSSKLRARQSLKEFIQKNKIGERMGPGAANVQEFQRAQYIAGTDIYEGLRGSNQLDKATWQKNMEQIYEDAFTQDELDTAWAVAQEASQEAQETGKPIPAIISQYLGQTKPGEGIASIKNEQTDKERRERGLPAAVKPARKSNPALWDEAMRQMEEDRQLQDNLIKELRDNPLRAVTDVESAILLEAQIRAETRHAAAVEKVNTAKDEKSTLDAMQEARQAEADLLDLYEVNRQAGSVSGSALQARKLTVGRDYSYAPLASQLRADQGGLDLTPKQEQVVRDVSQKVPEIQSVLDARIDTLQQQDSQKAYQEAVKDFSKEPVFDSRILRIANQIVAKLDAAANKARERIRSRALNFNAGVDPTVIYDLAVIGASKIARGLRDVAWKNSMREEFGEGINPHLDEIFQKADQMIDGMESEVPESDRSKVRKIVRKVGSKDQVDSSVQNIKTRISEGKSLNDLRHDVQQIALSLVRSGNTDPDSLLDAVHAIVEPLQPGLTKRQTMDLISGYGDSRQLDPEKAKVQLRDLKGQYQQLAKIEDIEARQPLRKTGMERRIPSDAERRLIKQVNDLKKKIGVVVTDPEKQLKSTLDSIKTGLKNQISDLTNQIETGERPPLGTLAPTSAEVERLRALRDRLNTFLEETNSIEKPGTFDEQVVQFNKLTKSAESSLNASIAHYESLIKGEQKKPRVTFSTPVTEALKAKRDAVKADLDAIRAADTDLQNTKAFDRVMKSLDELQAKLDRGDIQPKTKAQKIEDELVTEAREKLQNLRDQMQAARAASPEGQKARLDSAIEAVERSIASYDSKLKTGDVSPVPKGPSVSSPVLERLRAERDAMRKLVQDIRKGPAPDPEQVALKNFKARIARSIADLQDRIAKGDFSKKVRKPLDISKDSEAIRLLAEKEGWIKKFQDARHEARKAAETKTQTAIRYGKETLSLARSIKSAFDFSAVGRQGGILGVARPNIAARNLGKMFKSSASIPDVVKGAKEFTGGEFKKGLLSAYKQKSAERFYQEQDAALKARPIYNLAKASKLEITALDGEPTTREENFRSEWGDILPGIRGSNRAFNSYLNHLRMDYFEAMTGNAGWTLSVEDGKSIANYINIATGRGDPGRFANAAEGASHVLWSPRLLLSRIQFLLGQPVLKANSNRVRLLIAKEYARTLTNTAIFIALAALAGASVEKDPRSSDFGKIKIGPNRIDPLFGLQQVATFATRIGSATLNSINPKTTSGDFKTSKGKVLYLGKDQQKRTPADPTTNDVFWRFIQSKATPVLGGFLAGIRGEKVTGESTFMGREAAGLYAPMAASDLVELMQENGVPEAVALEAVNLFGLSVQSYDPNKKKKRD